MDELDPVEAELAQEAIDDFCRQFGAPGSHLYQAYRDFARHAALPLTFSADLLYRLQERFRRDMRGSALHIPWVAVADLMLSHLCHQVRPEIFRLDPHVQAVLLKELHEDRDRFWSEDGRSNRLQEVADFLIQYAAHQLNHPSHYVREAARAERLNAQTISQPELVREQLQKTAVALQPQQDPVATLRVASLVNSFNRSVNLTRSKTDPTRQDFNKLQAYTSGQAQLAEGKSATAVAQQFRTTFGSDQYIEIAGEILPLPTQVLQAQANPEEKVYAYRITVGVDPVVIAKKIGDHDELIGEMDRPLRPPSLEQTIQSSQFSTPDVAALTRMLNEAFSLIEFDNLLFDLGVDLGALTGTPSKGGRIREAVQYLRRRDQLHMLIVAAREARPQLDWGQISQERRSPTPTEFVSLLQRVEANQASATELRQFGQQLFDILFDEELRIDFLTFYETAVHDNAFLRLELQISHFNQDLTLLPWELLCLPGDTGFGTDWLAAAPELMLQKLHAPDEYTTHFLPASEPIRIALIVGPHAYDESPLLHEQLSNAYEKLAELYPNQIDFLGVMEGLATYEKFTDLVEWPHIVHLFVHSREASLKGGHEGQIALDNDPEGYTGFWMNGEGLARKLNAKPTLVLLQSNEFAQPDMLRGLQDVAANLIIGESNIPAVLSWQFPVENTAVTKFIHTVFPALAQGIPLDKAVQNGRRALLREADSLAFAAPSLFANAIVRRHTASEPAPPTLPYSLSVSIAGRSELVFLLRKGDPLPAVSETITLRDEHAVLKTNEGLAYQGILLFQGESTNPQENILLGEILLDDNELYEGILKIEAEVSVNSDNTIFFTINHQSGFSRELTLTFRDESSSTIPQILNFQTTLERYTRGVSTGANLPNFTKIDGWLGNADASRVMIITGELGAGKTTIAAQLAHFFSGELQPPNNLMGLTVTTTSSFYFCEPFSARTLHPRSFALTIASQWASRDSHFAYLQSTIDNHEAYELDELVKQLLIRPFTNIDELIFPGSIVFLVDDLEAALQHPGETTIVDVILRMLHEVPGVRFLLTAQMQPAVRNKLADVAAEFIHLGDRYDNLDIHIGPPQPDYDMRYPISISSAIGGDLQNIELSFSPETVIGERLLAHLRDLVSRPEEAMEVGQRLFQVLLREPTYDTVQRNLEYAQNRGKLGLRLRVQFDDPALQSYPWELCHDGRSFIFNNPDQPILLQRSVGTENVQAPPPLPRPVRLLVAIAAPVDQGRSDVKLQEKVIRAATEELVTSSELDLQILPHATLGELDRMVATYQPNMVQFIGHSSREKDGMLILENESGRSNLVPIAEITRILRPAPVQCVILRPIGVGETAVTQLAPQFIRQGILTVLAEQFVLPDQPAVEFWRAFYHALLLDRLSIEDGVWHGRNHLTTTHREPFWGHTILFSGQPEQAFSPETTRETDETQRGGRIWLEKETGFLYQGKQRLDNLRPLEQALLTFFVQNPHKTHTKSEIIQHVWPKGTQIEGVTDDSLYQVVRGVRQKIEPGYSQPNYLLTHRDVDESGYAFFPEGYREHIAAIISAKEFRKGQIWSDEDTNLLFKEDQLLEFTSSLDRRLLNFFIQNPYKKHTVSEIIENVWPKHLYLQGISNESVYRVISSVRQKIEPHPSDPVYLITWRDTPEGGYQFIPEPQV